MPEAIEVLVSKAMAKRLLDWPEYTEQPALVTRALLGIDQYTEELKTGPVLGVMRTSGSALTFESQPRTYAHVLKLAIWGYVRGKQNDIAADKLARLRRATIACLLSDDTLAGLVIDLCPDPDSRVDTDDGLYEPEAFFREIWRITVHEDF